MGVWQNNNKRGDTMSNQLNQALASAAASSAMEGMPLSDKDLSKVQGFYDKSLSEKRLIGVSVGVNSQKS